MKMKKILLAVSLVAVQSLTSWADYHCYCKFQLGGLHSGWPYSDTGPGAVGDAYPGWLGGQEGNCLNRCYNAVATDWALRNDVFCSTAFANRSGHESIQVWAKLGASGWYGPYTQNAVGDSTNAHLTFADGSNIVYTSAAYTAHVCPEAVPPAHNGTITCNSWGSCPVTYKSYYGTFSASRVVNIPESTFSCNNGTMGGELAASGQTKACAVADDHMLIPETSTVTVRPLPVPTTNSLGVLSAGTLSFTLTGTVANMSRVTGQRFYLSSMTNLVVNTFHTNSDALTVYSDGISGHVFSKTITMTSTPSLADICDKNFYFQSAISPVGGSSGAGDGGYGNVGFFKVPCQGIPHGVIKPIGSGSSNITTANGNQLGAAASSTANAPVQNGGNIIPGNKLPSVIVPATLPAVKAVAPAPM